MKKGRKIESPGKKVEFGATESHRRHRPISPDKLDLYHHTIYAHTILGDNAEYICYSRTCHFAQLSLNISLCSRGTGSCSVTERKRGSHYNWLLYSIFMTNLVLWRAVSIVLLVIHDSIVNVLLDKLELICHYSVLRLRTYLASD